MDSEAVSEALTRDNDSLKERLRVAESDLKAAKSADELQALRAEKDALSEKADKGKAELESEVTRLCGCVAEHEDAVRKLREANGDLQKTADALRLGGREGRGAGGGGVTAQREGSPGGRC